MNAHFVMNLDTLGRRNAEAAELVRSWNSHYDLRFEKSAGGDGYLTLTQNGRSAPLSETENIREKAIDFARRQMPGPPNYAPAMLFGIRAGYELEALFAMLHRPIAEPWQALYVIEPSPDLFQAVMASRDLTRIIEAENVFFFVGPHALSQLAGFLDADPNKPLPENIMVLGDQQGAQQTATILSQVKKQRMTKTLELKNRIDHYYSSRTPLQIHQSFAENAGLRVLLIGSGLSQYARFADRDIEGAFRRLGHQTFIVAQKDKVDRLSTLALLSAIDEFHPHIVHQIDHLRHEAADIFPPNLVFLTCMLDLFPSLESQESAAKMKDLDFVTGYCGYWHRFGYRRDRLLPMEPMVDESLFYPTKATPAQYAKFGAEVAYLSNVSATPEEYFQQLKGSILPQAPDCAQILRQFYEAVETSFRSGQILYSRENYVSLFAEISGADRVDAYIRDQIIHGFYVMVGNAFFRQLPLIRLSKAGVDLALWGHGWERHPTLSKHARGFAEHGETTNLIFNASKINLHLSPMAIRHNRLYEGFAAGAFFLVHKHEDASPFDLTDVLFAGGDQLVEKVHHYLTEPDAAKKLGGRNRNLVLERFTTTRQIGRAIDQLKAQVRPLMQFRAASENLEKALRLYPHGLCEALATKPLKEILSQITGPGFLDEPYDDAGAHRRALQWFNLFLEFDKHVLPADSYAPAALLLSPDDPTLRKKLKTSRTTLRAKGEKRLLRRLVSVKIDGVDWPYMPCPAPDGRLLVTGGIETRDEHKIVSNYLVDPRTGHNEKFLTHPGLQTGTFDKDGAYHAGVLGSGLFHFDPSGKATLLQPDGAGPTGCLHRCVVLPGGEKVVFEINENVGNRIWFTDGKSWKSISEPEQAVSGLDAMEDGFVFAANGRLFFRNIDGTFPDREFPEAPFGRHILCAGSEEFLFSLVRGVVATSDGTPRNRALALMGFKLSGEPLNILTPMQLSVPPITMTIFEYKGGPALALISAPESTLEVYRIGTD